VVADGEAGKYDEVSGGHGILRQQTWFASVVCTIAVLPGFIVGSFLKALMYVFGG
jgi:hypothetical protein